MDAALVATFVIQELVLGLAAGALARLLSDAVKVKPRFLPLLLLAAVIRGVGDLQYLVYSAPRYDVGTILPGDFYFSGLHEVALITYLVTCALGVWLTGQMVRGVHDAAV